ncbi:MAG: TetR/AcrR family transcriptional regulator [Thiomicrospira sp.]
MTSSFLHHVSMPPLQAKVLNSALVLFVEKSYFNTSIPDLVAHSGVSIGSIYKHFGDKEGVARTLLERLVEEIHQQQRAVLATQQTAQQRYQALARWMCQLTLDYPQVMGFVLYARHQAFLPDSSSICSSKAFMLLRDEIAAGMATGEVRQMDVMVAASIAFGSVLRLMQLHLDGVLEKPLMDYLDELLAACWRAIAVEP